MNPSIRRGSGLESKLGQLTGYTILGLTSLAILYGVARCSQTMELDPETQAQIQTISIPRGTAFDIDYQLSRMEMSITDSTRYERHLQTVDSLYEALGKQIEAIRQ